MVSGCVSAKARERAPRWPRSPAKTNQRSAASSSRGTVVNAYTHPVVDQPNRWRAIFDLRATGPDVVDLRAYLRQGDKALSETWIYQYFPEA